MLAVVAPGGVLSRECPRPLRKNTTEIHLHNLKPRGGGARASVAGDPTQGTAETLPTTAWIGDVLRTAGCTGGYTQTYSIGNGEMTLVLNGIQCRQSR